MRELREAGHDAAAVARFEQLLPTLQKGEPAFEALRSSVGQDAGEAFDWLAAIIRTANGDLPTGTRVAFDPTLVRGMGYYTGTIFEMSSPAFPSSIAGGGRYDRMVGKLLGRDVPACGFSIGFERLILILSDRAGVAVPEVGASTTAPRRLALVVDGHADLTSALAAARRLRGEGYLVSVELRRKNFGKQLDDFTRHGFWGFAAPEASGAVTVKPLTGARERG